MNGMLGRPLRRLNYIEVTCTWVTGMGVDLPPPLYTVVSILPYRCTVNKKFFLLLFIYLLLLSLYLDIYMAVYVGPLEQWV
jgi:hypothetical protein